MRVEERQKEQEGAGGYLDVREGPEPAVALLIGRVMLRAPLTASGIS